jgi:E3 ubiquitin-protein ligase DOA10
VRGNPCRDPQIITKRECRYCLSDDRIEKLIDPCNCEGTMKYVHQECLEDWIKNGNRQIFEMTNDKKMKIYVTICEICKYQMKYTKNYKNNLLQSILKMIKSIFGNFRNGLVLILHSIVIYFLVRRLKIFYREIINLYKKSFNIFNPTILMNLTHNLTVLTSVLLGVNDIYMFYSKLYVTKRKCLISFLPKTVEMK